MWGTGLLNGLRITMLNMIRGPITVQYPFEKLPMFERSRWAVEPIRDENGEHKCTACLNCVKVCPDHILELEVTTAEDKSKHIDAFRYELGACMMCGLCVEACPFSAIQMGKDYELAVTNVDDLVTLLLEDTPAVSAKKNRAEKPKPAPKPEAESTEATPATETPEATAPTADTGAPADAAPAAAAPATDTTKEAEDA